MKMNDWIDKLHGFLNINDHDILGDSGKISHDLMEQIVNKRYSEFQKLEARKDIEFDEVAVVINDYINSKTKRPSNR
jgi:hypothetical protein